MEIKEGKLKSLRKTISFNLNRQGENNMMKKDWNFDNLPTAELKMFIGALDHGKCRKIAAFMEINGLMPKQLTIIKEVIARETGRTMTREELSRISQMVAELQELMCGEMAKLIVDRNELNCWAYNLRRKEYTWISGATKYN